MRLSYILIFHLFLLPILVFFFTRGVVAQDEGYILYSSQKILEGLLPYRDFRFVYTPGALFATSLSFMIFGTSILSSRVLMLILALIGSILTFKIIDLSTKNKLYATIASLIFISWGPSHINISWPIMFAIPAGLATCYLLIKFLQSRNSKYLYIAGLAAFSVFLFKQNFGAAILLSCIPFFLIKSSRKITYPLTFIYGYLWGIILFMIYLVTTGSFAGFLDDFYFFTIKWIIQNKSLTTNFIYPDAPFTMALRTLFYLIPVIVCIGAIVILSMRRRFHLLFLPTFVISFYLLSIRPTTDYIHLAPLLSLVGIPIALFFRYNISQNIRLLLFAFSFALILLGFQTALFKGYYRWEDPIIYHNYIIENPKIMVMLNSKLSFEFSAIKKAVDSVTQEGDYIYVNSYDQMLYFVTNRKEPLRDNFLSLGNDPLSYYDKVIGALVSKKIKVLILTYKSLPTLPIKDYINRHYTFHKTFHDYDMYIRNP